MARYGIAVKGNDQTGVTHAHPDACSDTPTEALPQAQDNPTPEHQDRPQKRRVFGSAKGLIHILDGFDDPLDDFADY